MDEGEAVRMTVTVVETAMSCLCERLLDRAATSEGTGADDHDHNEHEGKDDPTDPRESLERLGRVTVRERVALARARERSTSVASDSAGTTEPEGPGHKDDDGVTGNRSEDAANASKKESGLLERK